MSGSAIRDVTVRVGVIGAKAEGLEKFREDVSATDAYLKSINSEMKNLTAESKLMSSAISEFAENIKSVAAVDLGDMGLGSAKTAVEEYTEAQKASVEAANEAATQQVEATKEIETAVKQEEKTATESAFKRIALAERLAAHQRKAAKEVEQQEKAKSDAYKKAAQDQQAQMFAATGALAGSLAAGTQFIATLQLIAGESEEIEELARQFAKVQGIVGGIAAGTQAFNSLNQGLTSLQAAATAATSQLTLTGSAATFTQVSLIRLAPAAAVAQAALGPVALAITGIALAVTAVSAVSNYFKEELPDETEASRRAFERLNRELENTKRKVDANARSLDAQNHFLRAELEIRKLLSGQSTAADVEEGLSLDIKAATDTASGKLLSEQAAARKAAAELQQQREALKIENDKLFKSGRGITGNKEMTKEASATFEENKRRMFELDSQISEQRQIAEGVGIGLSETTMSEFATAIRELPEEQRAAAAQTLKDFESAIQTAVGAAKSDVTSQLGATDADIATLEQSRRDALSSFETEQNTALRLQNDPAARGGLEEAVNLASASGNLNAGIDAVSSVVGAGKEQELRNMLAQGNLTREKLLAEIADAAEFETERAQLEKQIEVLNEQRRKLDSTRERLLESQEAINQRIDRLGEEVLATQKTMQSL